MLRSTRFRQLLQRWLSSDQSHEAQILLRAADRDGGTPVGLLPDRQLACICGTVRTLTLRPRSSVPALVAQLYDGSGLLTIIWLGRRQIPGIEVGRRIRVRGRVAQQATGPVLYNPAYELLQGVRS